MERVAKAAGVDQGAWGAKAKLAAALGMSHQSLFNCFSRGNIPWEAIIQFGYQRDVSLDTLFFGVGNMMGARSAKTFEREIQKQTRALVAALKRIRKEADGGIDGA